MRISIGSATAVALFVFASSAGAVGVTSGSALPSEPGRSVERGVVVWRGAEAAPPRLRAERDVRVWRGEPSPASGAAPEAALGASLEGAAPVVRERTVVVYCGASRLNRLRTQGFYSGHPLAPTPRYSQGFWSGPPEAYRGCYRAVVSGR